MEIVPVLASANSISCLKQCWVFDIIAPKKGGGYERNQIGGAAVRGECA